MPPAVGRPASGALFGECLGDGPEGAGAWCVGALKKNKKHHIFPTVFTDAFYFVLVTPPPWGPGKGLDGHFPKETGDFGPTPAQIRGCFLVFFILALLTVS